MSTWESEIRKVMSECGYRNHAKDVIKKVKENANGTESNELLYDRAWAKFKTILMA